MQAASIYNDFSQSQHGLRIEFRQRLCIGQPRTKCSGIEKGVCFCQSIAIAV